MNTRRWVIGLGAAVVLGSPLAADAAAPAASCVGQALSVFGPAFGSSLGQQVAFEAQHPEVLGAPNLGAAVAGLTQADRADCPEE